MIALKRKGVEIFIFALKKSKDRKCHDRAKNFIEKTNYRPSFISFQQWKIFFIFLFQHPILFFQLFFTVFQEYKKSPLNLIKAYRNFLCVFYFAKLIKQAGIQQIHAHFAFIPATIAMIISKYLDIPFSFSAHAWDIYANRANLKKELHSANFIVTCSEYNKAALLVKHGDAFATKIYRIYHGISLEYWSSSRKNRNQKKKKKQAPINKLWKLITVGRLIEKKGFEYLIKACGLLKQNNVKFHLDLVGAGRERSTLEKLSRELGLKNEITFVGTLTSEELKKYYSRADVFILPSIITKDGDRDNIPNVLLEAMAMGIPVISTDVSAIPELVKDGETGILAKEKDERSLFEVIRRVIHSNRLRSNIADFAMRKIEKDFVMENNIKTLYCLFKESIS